LPRNSNDAIKGPSTMALAWGFHSGAVGSMIGTYDASYAHPDTHFLEICGTRGRLVVTDTVGSFAVSGRDSCYVPVCPSRR
jgi:predicted dehydrogenase